jgi:hypothetical protein
MLAYTLDRLLTQTAVIQRNVAAADAFGADVPPDWQPHLTVACLLWWARSTGARSANRTYVSPARQAAVSEGGLLMPLGTDVTEQDRIMQINTPPSEEPVAGLLEIVAVLNQWDHLEVEVTRVHLGA